MAEQKRPDDHDRRGTIPFVNDAADAPDQQPPVDANFDKAIAAEEHMEQAGYPNAGTIPLPKDEDETNDASGEAGEVRPQND